MDYLFQQKKMEERYMDDDVRHNSMGDRETWHPDLKKALLELDGLSRYDQDLLLAHFVKNGFDRRGLLRRLLDAPEVLAHALCEARQRRPMTSFMSFVAQVSAYNAPRWLDDEKTAERMFGADIVFQEVHKVSRLAVRLKREAEKLCSVSRIYEHTPPEQVQQLTPSERFNATEVAPLLYLKSGDAEEDWIYLWSRVSGFCTEQFARTLFRRKKDMVSGRLGSSPASEEVGVQLMRFGLHELDPVEFGSLDHIKSALPPGARFAGMETIAAIAEYPLLLKWIDQSPNGGHRSKRASLWMMGVQHDDRDQCQYLRLVHENDVFGAPRIAGHFFDELTARECKETAVIIPYVIPTASFGLDDLKRMLNESP